MADDVDDDGFVFRVTRAREHLVNSYEAGGPGLHLSVSADLAGKPFAQIRLDVVARPAEVHPRPSTRVKDLLDIVLVADAGMVGTP